MILELEENSHQDLLPHFTEQKKMKFPFPYTHRFSENEQNEQSFEFLKIQEKSG